MFARHIGFEVPPAVSGLYCYADEIGVDVTYQLAFTADSATVERVVAALSLKQGQPGFVVGIGRELPWWQPEDHAALVPYWRQTSDGGYFWFLWYDRVSQRVWLLEYSV
jgi:hypothetical protein